jgi:hypothetical protein
MRVRGVLRRGAISACSAAILIGATAGADPARGPLRVLTANPRYFTDGSGHAVYLAGSHTWDNLQDLGTGDPPPRFDYDAFLDFLVSHHHNFFRLWAWELPHGTWRYCSPLPWQRTGPGVASDGKPRFDLASFDDSYFERLRTRVIEAGRRGIYVSVMLFDGFDVEFYRQPTDGYPLDAGNNINGVSAPGVTSQDLSRPQVTAVEDAYVRKVVDTVNDLDNVLYEIANEAGGYSTRWQYHMIRLVKELEATKPKQHPVGMTAQFTDGTDQALFASDADWISPLDTLAPEATGRKVVINDSDHSFGYRMMQAGGTAAQIAWAWDNFAHGNNIAFMDPYLTVWPGRNSPGATRPDPVWEVMRTALMDVRDYAARIDLLSMTPHGNLVAGGGFCLAHPGSQYLVFSPAPERLLDRALEQIWGRRFTVSTVAGSYAYEWFDPQLHRVAARGTIVVGERAAFTVPFAGSAVLWLHR